jgi:hypothetical protein
VIKNTICPYPSGQNWIPFRLVQPHSGPTCQACTDRHGTRSNDPRDPGQSHRSAWGRAVPAVGSAPRTAAATPAQRPPRLARPATWQPPIRPPRTHDAPANATRSSVGSRHLVYKSLTRSNISLKLKQTQFRLRRRRSTATTPRRGENREEGERVAAAMDRVRGSALLLGVLLAGAPSRSRSRTPPPAVPFRFSLGWICVPQSDLGELRSGPLARA